MVKVNAGTIRQLICFQFMMFREKPRKIKKTISKKINAAKQLSSEKQYSVENSPEIRYENKEHDSNSRNGKFSLTAITLLI